MVQPTPDSPRLAAVRARLDARIDWEKRERGAMRVDVEPSRDLLARLGDLTARFPVVHVAGTKGKGSVASLVSAGLVRAGLRVGLYTSPHVERLNERVRLDGAPVDDDTLAAGLEEALDARERAERAGTPAGEATWFDLVTAAAAWVFADAGVDAAVLEVGLGGRLDSTNAFDGEVCVVTSIDLEHTAILGGTRALIAREKGGILKPGAGFVCGVLPDPALAPEDDPAVVLRGLGEALGVERVDVAPGPDVASTNRALAGAALDLLGRRGTRGRDGAPVGAGCLDAAAEAAARLPGRLERRVLGGVPVVLDGAHVASSLRRLLEDLAADPALDGAPEVVVAVARDKDHPALLKTLRSRVDRVLCSTVPSGIHLSAEDLARLARDQGLEARVEPDARAAVVEACARVRPGGWVLVTGSLYLVGAVRDLTAPPTTTEAPRGC